MISLNKEEIYRLIQQYLTNQGHSDIAQQIKTKTNVSMEPEYIEKFREYILSG
jgi:hypothetical protein